MTPLEARRILYQAHENQEECKPFLLHRSCSRSKVQESAQNKLVHGENEDDKIRRASSYNKIRSESITNLIKIKKNNKNDNKNVY